MIETIGILGGGQLGRMMCIAAKQMGYRVVVLDPTPDCPCGQVSDKIIVASYDNSDACQLLLNQCDVITYEFENIPLSSASMLEAKLPQTSRLLEITQDRILEKEAIRINGLKTTPYLPILLHSDMELFAKNYRDQPYPVFIKTAQGGYDGKGQYVLENVQQLDYFLKYQYQSGKRYLAEKAVAFEKELSVIVCRNISGEMTVFPVSENIHRNRILHQSIIPARIKSSLIDRIEQMARQLATGINLVGSLALELFLFGNEILVNELAPRPHNSGHYTLNACLTSQFEQHIRAICNLPLGDVHQISPCVMLNILGEDMAFLNRNKIGKHKLHLYGKTESRAGRKMGHINILDQNIETCLQIAENIL